MNKASTLFLQFVTVLVAIAALAFLILEPQHEGVNVGHTLSQIYFHDPFLAYAYIASVPFFMILFQAFKVLGRIGKNEIFTPVNVKAMRTIRYCAIAMVCFVIGGEIFILSGTPEELPPPLMMGLIITIGSATIAAAATMFGRMLAR